MQAEINKLNYHTPIMSTEYIGSSQFKSFQKCEYSALLETRGLYKRPESKAMLVGSYVDAYFSNELAQFIAEHPYIAPKEAPDGHVNIFTAKGELGTDFKEAVEIIHAIESDSVFRKLLSGEPQKIMTGYIAGVPVKIKIDSFHTDKTVDLKVLKSLDDEWIDGAYRPWWYANRYDIQAAIYQIVRAQNEDGVKKPFILSVITKEKGFNKGQFMFSQEVLDAVLAEVANYLPRIEAIKNGEIEPIKCDNCECCYSGKKLIENNYIVL